MKSNFRRFLKFCLVGGLNTLMDVVAFSFLTLCGMTIIPAQFISYSLGVLNSFFMNRSWTFCRKEKTKGSEFLKFITVNIFTLTISTLLLNWLYNHYGMSIFLCKLIATGCGILINYGGTKFWVFSSNKPLKGFYDEKIDKKY